MPKVTTITNAAERLIGIERELCSENIDVELPTAEAMKLVHGSQTETSYILECHLSGKEWGILIF